MRNRPLNTAKRARNDEFYTQYADIEAEVSVYLDRDPDVFRGKTILLPCDDPDRSQFTRWFLDNAERAGWARLISTCWVDGGRGRILDTAVGMDVGELEGDGDFRSPEVTALRDQSDFIITNPPFSLFREFFAWVVEA